MHEMLITVAMPVFNAGKFLKPALLSIINQTYTNWELIIVDDGSTDGCFDDLPELNDVRIKVLSDKKNKGIAFRLNEIIDMAKGDYLARMDSDDISHPQRFELQLKHLQSFSYIDLVATRAFTIDKDSKITGELPFKETHNEICARPWLGFYMPHPSWMGKMDWFKKHRYAEPAFYLCEDQELLLRSFSTSKFSTLNQHLLSYRVDNSINKKLFKTRVAFFKAQFQYFINNHNYYFLMLACAVLLGRLVKDSTRNVNSFYKGRGV